MKKIKDTLKDGKLYIFLLITLVFFGTFARLQFAVDTYSVFTTPIKDTINIFLTSGRLLSAILYGIFGIFNFTSNKMYICSFLIAIISCTLALYKLYKIIRKDIKNDYLSLLLSTIIIINPFSIEFFMYLEKCIFFVAIFLAICAVEQFINFMQKINVKKSLVLSIVYMLLVTFSYQGVLAIFISIACIYVIKYSKNIKEFFINNISLFLCYGVPAIINLLVIRIFFSNSRVSGNINFGETIQKILDGLDKMFNTYNILPGDCYKIFFVITLIVSLIVIIKEKNFKAIFGILYVVALNILITIVPYFMQDTESIWFVPRSSYAFASILGLVILFTMINVRTEESKFIIVKESLFIILSVLLLIVQFYNFNKITIDNYNSNYTDKINSLKIGEMIRNYEDETGIEITGISMYLDKSHSYSYPLIFATGDINVNGFGPDWCDVEMINYYNNLNLERVENSEEVLEMFKEKDFNNFSEMQVVFIGNIVHICKF